MLYLTCTTISSVDLAQYGVSLAKDWVSVECGTNVFNLTILMGHCINMANFSVFLCASPQNAHLCSLSRAFIVPTQT